ncbi:MAG: endonuclease domain-containing protein [Paludibacteraceae bacterium]|nr:endonuclease domain-containing protein [Paludibacteraceae bacterium]
MKAEVKAEKEQLAAVPTGVAATYSESELKRQLSKFFPSKFVHMSRVASSVIADFYCDKAKLIIELESKVHDGDSFITDEKRRELVSKGFSVIRVSNYDIFNNIKKVLANVERVMNAKGSCALV